MITQEQIARKLKVSRQLVSFALAGYPQVSEKSRQRILNAARKMGYRPNPHARALRRGRTGIIALWIPDQISSYYARVTRELAHLVKAERHELIVSEIGTMAARQALSHVPVDGILVVDAPGAVQAYLQEEGENALPIICMGAQRCDDADFVQVDLKAGTMELMDHLIGAGFRRIVHATFMRKNQPGASRVVGYVQAMEKAGLQPEILHYALSEEQRVVVRGLIRDFVQEEGKPEVVFCHSDDIALGIYRGLCDLKLRVPEDIAIAGCDGIQDTEYLECPLTTIVQPVAEMCSTAWSFLLRRLETPEMKRQGIVLRPKLVVRESTSRRSLTDAQPVEPALK